MCNARGGGLSPKSYVDVPAGPQKSDYLYTNFWPNFPPISIPFLKEKHPILIKLGAFYNNLPKIHPIYVIWAPSSLMKTPRSLYQISRKSAPKGRHIYTYTMSMWEPPPPGCNVEDPAFIHNCLILILAICFKITFYMLELYRNPFKSWMFISYITQILF